MFKRIGGNGVVSLNVEPTVERNRVPLCDSGGRRGWEAEGHSVERGNTLNTSSCRGQTFHFGMWGAQGLLVPSNTEGAISRPPWIRL